MEVTTFEREGVRVVECAGAIAGTADVLDLVAACLERDATRLLIDARHLPPAFFVLRSGFAGELLQKLENYRIRLAIVLPPSGDHGEAFAAFVAEGRRGHRFRVFAGRAESEAWLTSG